MTEHDDSARPAPDHWVEALERSEAQLAEGRVVDGAAMRQRLRDSIARMRSEMEPTAGQSRKR